ncbi:hypothetical protein, partial [Pseudomonas marginalis]|uniref:hypothetical protein n=1 Tax=Pseudomonas marginalis TaxID=298 RepID=UPI0020336B7E
LRPAVELYTVAICFAAAVLCVYLPWAVALSPEIGLVAALAYANTPIPLWEMSSFSEASKALALLADGLADPPPSGASPLPQ